MRNKPRVVVIGLGNMGTNHVRIVNETAHLAGVCDINKELGRQFSQKYSVQFFSDSYELIEKVKPDAVVIATPTSIHFPITKYCLKNNIPALVEKPLTDDVKKGEILSRISTSGKSIIWVGHVERFNPAVIKLKKLINSNKLGDIVSLSAVRVGIHPPPGLKLDVLLDLGIHDIDIFNWLLGEYPKDANIYRQKIVESNIADSAFAFLRYKKVVGVIQTNWITPVKIRYLYVSGLKGFAELDYINQTLTLYDRIQKLVKNSDFITSTLVYSSPKQEILVEKREPLKEQMKFFLTNLHNPRLSNITDALKAMEIVFKH